MYLVLNSAIQLYTEMELLATVVKEAVLKYMQA